MIIMNINSASECVCACVCACKEVYMHSCVLVKSNLKKWCVLLNKSVSVCQRGYH